MVAVLMVLSGLFAVGGLVFLNQATMGVGLIGFGCYLAIVGRMAQADRHIDDAGAITTKISSSQIQCRKCGHIAPRGPAACPSCGAGYGS